MYTAKQVRDERISFKPMSREQFDKLEAHFRKLNYATPSYWIEDNYYRFYPVDCGKQADSFGSMETEYELSYYKHPYNSNISKKMANILCNVLVNGDFNTEDKTDYLTLKL